MASANIPYVDQSIIESIQQINELLYAIMQMDVSLYSDLRNGTVRLGYTDATNSMSIQRFVNGTWLPIAKLMVNVEKLDGYDASTVPQANTIPVRNAQGSIAGDITGNANSADTAQALSEVNPIGMGGTGANSLAGARNNLGISQLDLDVEALDIEKFDKSGGNISGILSVGTNEEHLFYVENGQAAYRATYEPNSYWYLSVSASGWNFNNASVYNLLDVSTKTITLSGAGTINSTNAFISINTALTIGLEQYHYLYKDASGAGVWRVRTPNGQYVYITGDNTGFSFNGSSLVSINDLSCNTVYAQNAQLSGALSVPSITADEYYLSDGSSLMLFPNYQTPIFEEVFSGSSDIQLSEDFMCSVNIKELEEIENARVEIWVYYNNFNYYVLESLTAKGIFTFFMRKGIRVRIISGAGLAEGRIRCYSLTQ